MPSLSSLPSLPTHSITGGDGLGVFTIDSGTGGLQVAPCTDFATVDCLNTEEKASYTVDVTVTDNGGLSNVATMAITVVDVNEVTKLIPPARRRNENPPATSR